MAHLAFLKLVPREIWYVLIAAILYRGAIAWYEDKLADAYDRGATEAYAKVEGKARLLDRQAQDLTLLIRSTFDAKRSRIDAATAGELRLGPGKAASRCPAAALPGRQEPRPRTALDAANSLPEDDRVTDRADVSWNWLVVSAQTADLNHAEVMACRAQHDGLVKAYQSQLPPG